MSSSPLDLVPTQGVEVGQRRTAGRTQASRSTTRRRAGERRFTPFLLVGPHALVLAIFLILPIAMIVAVSFWQVDGYRMVPAFSLDNYAEILGQPAYRSAYLNTFKYGVIV